LITPIDASLSRIADADRRSTVARERSPNPRRTKGGEAHAAWSGRGSAARAAAGAVAGAITTAGGMVEPSLAYRDPTQAMLSDADQGRDSSSARCSIAAAAVPSLCAEPLIHAKQISSELMSDVMCKRGRQPDRRCGCVPRRRGVMASRSPSTHRRSVANLARASRLHSVHTLIVAPLYWPCLW
jgi:hypothetical protein